MCKTIYDILKCQLLSINPFFFVLMIYKISIKKRTIQIFKVGAMIDSTRLDNIRRLETNKNKFPQRS